MSIQHSFERQIFQTQDALYHRAVCRSRDTSLYVDSPCGKMLWIQDNIEENITPARLHRCRITMNQNKYCRTHKRVDYNMSENLQHSVFYREPNSFEFILEQEYMLAFNHMPSYRTWNTVSNIQIDKAFSIVEQKIVSIFKNAGYSSESVVKRALFAHTDMSDVSNDAVDGMFHSESSSFQETIFINSINGEHPVVVSVMSGYSDTMRFVVLTKDNKSPIIPHITKMISEELVDLKKVKNEAKPTFNIITEDSNGLSLQEFDIAKLAGLDTFIEDHYNDDFAEIADLIVDTLTNANKGITLLHGFPGTGKTNFIRYLANKVTKKRLIYIPPELTGVLASPGFISFVMEHKNSIFIVEDAENAIKTREAGASSSVTNILNMSDGIIGDAVQCQFVCTFNAEYDDIDHALRRKGRLNAKYEFKPLSIEKAQRLIAKIHGTTSYVVNEPMTLADIYNLNSEDFGKLNEPAKTIGFI